MQVIIEKEAGDIPDNLIELLNKVANAAAEVLEIGEEQELSVVLTDNKAVQELNLEYRGIDAPTDVLSFAMNDEAEGEPEILDEDINTLLGDVVISVERAKTQADDYGHSWEREMGFLLCHGILHLMGYDHMESEDEKKMFGLQDTILERIHLTRD